MKDRIKQIMEAQHMTQQVFASFIDQSPATLSSIFNGRTRPTLNIVEAIKKKIPDINTDWLMFGSGSMFLDSVAPSEGDPNETDATATTHPTDQNPMLLFDDAIEVSPKNASQAGSNINSVRNTHQEFARTEVKIADKPQRRITEIRVFYDDQTWETFVPQKK